MDLFRKMAFIAILNLIMPLSSWGMLSTGTGAARRTHSYVKLRKNLGTLKNRTNYAKLMRAKSSPLKIKTVQFDPRIGSVEEAIRAAKEQREPVYINELMSHFSLQLESFTKDIKSPRERLALLRTMQEIMIDADHLASKLFRKAIWKNAWDDSSCRYRHLDDGPENSAWYFREHDMAAYIQKFDGFRVTREIDGAVKQAAYETGLYFDYKYKRPGPDWADFECEMVKVAQKAAKHGTTLEEKGDITYRASELVLYNLMLEYGTPKLKAAYDRAMRQVPEYLENNPLEDIKSWIKFRDRHFDNNQIVTWDLVGNGEFKLTTARTSVRINYLKPWLNAFDAFFLPRYSTLARERFIIAKERIVAHMSQLENLEEILAVADSIALDLISHGSLLDHSAHEVLGIHGSNISMFMPEKALFDLYQRKYEALTMGRKNAAFGRSFIYESFLQLISTAMEEVLEAEQKKAEEP